MDKINIVSPVEEAAAEVKHLQTMHWFICSPTKLDAATVAPSGSSNYFSVDQFKVDMVVMGLTTALGDIFKSNGHQNSSWKEFAIETDMSVGRSVVGYRANKSESHLRECLLSPILNTVVRRMALLPGESMNFEAFLLPEENIRLHDGSGRPACVDYVVRLENSDRVLKCIPIEAKQAFSTLYIKQLSAYMNKLATCADFNDQVLVGLLLMEDSFHIAFSPFKWAETNRAVPVVYITPSIKWRNSQCVSSSGLLLLSVLHLFNMKRIEYPPSEESSILMDVTNALYKDPYIALSCSFVSEDTPFKRLALIQRQTAQLVENDRVLKLQILQLKQSDAELKLKQRELEEKLKQHEEKIEELQLTVSPPKRLKYEMKTELGEQ